MRKPKARDCSLPSKTKVKGKLAAAGINLIYNKIIKYSDMK